MKFDPATKLQDLLVFGEFGDVNPSISDSSTYTFFDPAEMEDSFVRELPGRFVYSRLSSPTNKYLSRALASMEGAEAAVPTSSGMAAIACTFLALCKQGDEVVASPTIYGGTFALLSNLMTKFGVKTNFVDFNDLAAVRQAITKNTKVIYCETLNNPLLHVADLPKLSALAKEFQVKLVVDNTFSPMVVSPIIHGVDVVVYSITKFINGTSDCMAGAIIGKQDFIEQLSNPNTGPAMLTGPALDPMRSASILKNMHSLHLRMKKHGENALFIARKFMENGFEVMYPGLSNHPGYNLLKQIANPDYGCSGILTINLQQKKLANEFMVRMQTAQVGYLAVSLGYYKTLFCAPSHSTSSEIPAELRHITGLGDGIIRFSIGLDNDIAATWAAIEKIINDMNLKKLVTKQAAIAS